MNFSYRPMRANDMADCVALIAAQPVLRARYGGAIERLPDVWSHLLIHEAFRTAVLQVSESNKVRIVGVGIAAFVADDFMRRIKTAPFIWIGPELVDLVGRGHSPLLSDAEVATANSIREGLNSIFWVGPGVFHAAYVRQPELANMAIRAALQMHSGYCVREVVSQGECGEHVKSIMNAGGLLFCDREKGYRLPRAEEGPNLLNQPHLFGLTRDLAAPQIGTWLTEFFKYEEPRLHLTRGQQRLLMEAMDGATDAELAAQLNISVAAVKRTWRDIYDRVYDRVPELFPPEWFREEGGSKRGKAKKPRLLSHLRDHPEELRPIARKNHCGRPEIKRPAKDLILSRY